MKSLSNDALHIVLGIFADVSRAYPEYRGIVRDISRFTSLSNSRGMGFYTLDLPHLDSLLTKGLDSGRLSLNGPLSTAVSKRIRVPRIFSGLWLRIFDKNSCLRSDPDPTAVFLLRSILCFGKKIAGVSSSDRVSQSVRDYHNVESEIRNPTLNWEGDCIGPTITRTDLHFRDDLYARDPVFPEFPAGTFVPTYGTSGQGRLQVLCANLQQHADEFATSIGVIEPSILNWKEGDDPFWRPKHGPGAVADRSGTYIDKYKFTNWSKKLGNWFPFTFFGESRMGISDQVPGLQELPSRLIAVPKTAKGPRLIAAEPTEYQWVQQFLKSFMETKIANSPLARVIDFKSQEKSRVLAREASLDGSGATVDLSSASDRLSCWVVERAFRMNPSFLACLHSSRTRWTKDEISHPPKYLRKKKFASQGTAVTFPVQTVIFALCALAVMPGRTLKDKVRRWGSRIQVFGDDIIIPSTGYADLTLLLNYLGLKVNEDKSFVNGRFREACGFDGFMGYDVTPLKPMVVRPDGPTSRASLIDLSNNFFKKGLWSAAKAVESMMERTFKCLPSSSRDVGSSARFSFCGADYSGLKSRYNHSLHRDEVRVWSPRTTIPTKVAEGSPRLLQYFIEDPSRKITSYESGLRGRSKTSDRLRWEPVYSFE